MADVLGYLTGEKKRKEQGIRDLLNMFLMSKQIGEKRGERKWEKDIEERRLTSLEDYRKAQIKEWERPEALPKPPPFPATIQEAIVASGQGGVKSEGIDWSKVAEVLNEWQYKEPKPSAYTLRKRDLDKALKLNTITQEQYNRSLFNLKQELTPEEKRRKGASIRDSNIRELRDFYKNIPELIDKGQIKPRELRKIIGKQGGGTPVSQQGYRLDMPERYNRAILNQKDGVATIEDEDIIKNYEDMFKIFQDELKDYPTFKNWINNSPISNLVGLDKNQMKIWYDIYAEKESFLERIF